MISRRAHPLVSPLVLVGSVCLAFASDAASHDLLVNAKYTVAQYRATDPGVGALLRASAGYAVFPNVGKGGLIVGGAEGDGILYEGGQAVGKVKLTQVSVGAQIGGQAFSELILFQTPWALQKFKHDELSFSAQTSAVALTAGASGHIKYTDGIAAMTSSKGGLMAEATLAGQKFHYEPFATVPPS